MKYSLSKLRDSQGYVIKNPKQLCNVSIDITNKLAMAFSKERPVEVLQVMDLEARADGLYLRGLEKCGDDQLRYQEWFLAYPKEGL